MVIAGSDDTVPKAFPAEFRRDVGAPPARSVGERVLGFFEQAFDKWKAQPVTQRDWGDAHLIHAARKIHHDDPEFGYRFIADELADQGVEPGATGCSDCAARRTLQRPLPQAGRAAPARPARP